MTISIFSTQTVDVGGTAVSRPPDVDPSPPADQIRQKLIDVFTAAANGDTMGMVKACLILKLLYLQQDQTNMNNKVKWYGALDTMLKNIDNALAALSNKDQNVSEMTDINKILGLVLGLGSNAVDPDVARYVWNGRQRLSTPREQTFTVYRGPGSSAQRPSDAMSLVPANVQAEIRAGRARIVSNGSWSVYSAGRGSGGYRRDIRVAFDYAQDEGIDYINRYLNGDKMSQGDIMRMKNYFLDVRNAVMHGQNVEGLSSSLKAILDEIQRTKDSAQNLSQTLHQALMAS
ncbi:hypothetical protein NQT62_03630 [Limnobacter humi]|uniref:RiboL-PSP-HEPN domain-containing protein n=1 Tax=Limnobacter humi TaxID=1778671 RepID=A0ABT1WDD4_9BURK|nr:hypothetical protein [Limnobacter humi]MCQ8895531.1 hypothetical protein [Limnobacter humi]